MIERRDIGFLEVKADADQGVISGYGAVFGNEDGKGDVIRRGAFAESLKEWKARGKYPKMLLQHGGWGMSSDDMMPVGQWTNMEENSRGLKVDGRIFAMSTERGQYIYEGLKSGELDSLSIGYMTRKYEIDEEQELRILTDIDLWEVSLVTFPANDKARITSVKNLSVNELREIEGRLRDGGLSRREAVIASSVLKNWLQRDAAAPHVDGSREDSTSSDEERRVLEAISGLTDAFSAEVFRS